MNTKTRILTTAIAILVVSAWFASSARAGGNFDLFVGQKELDRDFGSGTDIEEQDAAAVFMDFGRSSVRFAVDLLAGRKDVDDHDLNVHLNGSTGEIGVGVRFYPTKDSRFLPHVGGGLGLVSGKVSTQNPDPSNDISFDDSKLGYWADGGLAYRVGDHFKVGGRVRYSKAKLDNPGGKVEEVDAGGLTYGVNAGWTW